MNIPVKNGYINVANGDLHLEIPFSQLKQRGNLALDEKLVYDSRIWMIGHYSNYYWWPTNVPNSSDGWRFVTGAETGTLTADGLVTTTFDCGLRSQCYDDQVSYEWTDPSNTVHQFDVVWDYENDVPAQEETDSRYAADASGYTIQLSGMSDKRPTSIAIYDTNGTEVYPKVADRYGNYFSSDANGNLIDSLGRTPVVFSPSIVTQCREPNDTGCQEQVIMTDIPGKASNEYVFNAFGQRASVWDVRTAMIQSIS